MTTRVSDVRRSMSESPVKTTRVPPHGANIALVLRFVPTRLGGHPACAVADPSPYQRGHALACASRGTRLFFWQRLRVPLLRQSPNLLCKLPHGRRAIPKRNRMSHFPLLAARQKHADMSAPPAPPAPPTHPCPAPPRGKEALQSESPSPAGC